MRNQIKFYGASDMSFGPYLTMVVSFLKTLDITKNYYTDINKVLEFYNIIQYAKIKGCPIKDIYKDKVSFIYKQVNLFIAQLDESNFRKYYNKVDSLYYEDFWKLIDNNVKTLNLSPLFFKKFLNSKKCWIRYILECKNIVNTYNDIIKQYLLKCKLTAEFLVDEIEIEHHFNHKTLYFPEFDTNELNKMFENYINDEKANLNYLQIIPDIKNIKISDKVKLLALKKEKEQSKQLFSNGGGMKIGSEVAFGEFDETMSEEYKDGSLICKYDTKWIKENLAYPTLLNNFIYLLKFVDKQMRFTNISKESELGIFEHALGIHTKGQYLIGMSFRVKQMACYLKMISYIQELEKYEVKINQLLEWFYTTYLKEEFGVDDFLLYMPSEGTNYFEKCRILFPEIDGIIKQFSIFQEYKEIDHDLLEISSSSVPFDNIKSLVKKKYVYSNEEKTRRLFFLLFSNQSMMHYNEKYERHETFFELITKENIPLKDFPDYQQEDLKWLFSQKYIKVNKQGFVKFANIKQIVLLYDLKNNEVINYYHYPIEFRKELDKLIRKDICYFENTLLSKPEVEYLNYYLNDRFVTNGLSLRNRYGHGTQPKKDKEEVHHQNYIWLLYIVILITIKINDDFCLYDEFEKI